MNYFICQEWKSTKGNHAGMSHLCRLIKDCYKNEVRVITVPVFENFFLKYTRPIYHLYYFLLGFYLSLLIRKGDKIFLMEYMMPTRNQRLTASIIKLFCKHSKILGLSHLTPIDMNLFFPTKKKLLSWSNKVDTVLTLGSSLSSYLKDRGVNNVVTSFHYVDMNYYKPTRKYTNDRIKAIIMGGMQRNLEDLEYVVEKCPEIDFILCKGRSKKDTTNIEKFSNLQVLGYLSEDELRGMMDKSDISLNMMYDTIGSNVITTSLSMGLIMIVSDVGSIRDYCKDDFSFFCKTKEDFVSNLHYCSATNREEIELLKKKSKQMANNLSFNKFYEQISNLE